MKIMKSGLLIVLVFTSTLSHAVSCTEKITSVILEKNGNVHFNTNGTCSNTWCRLNWAGAEAMNRGYTLLLAAYTAKGNVRINWSGISSCGQYNSTGASPEYMYLTE